MGVGWGRGGDHHADRDPEHADTFDPIARPHTVAIGAVQRCNRLGRCPLPTPDGGGALHSGRRPSLAEPHLRRQTPAAASVPHRAPYTGRSVGGYPRTGQCQNARPCVNVSGCRRIWKPGGAARMLSAATERVNGGQMQLVSGWQRPGRGGRVASPHESAKGHRWSCIDSQ
jgi:hypothetical protein